VRSEVDVVVPSDIEERELPAEHQEDVARKIERQQREERHEHHDE